MKNMWKWILGILIAVAVIVAAVFGVRYLINQGYVTTPAGFAWHDKANRGFDNQRGPQDFNGWNYGPMMYDRNHNFGGFGPREHGRGFGHFGFAFLFIGGLLRLAIFGALLYGAYWLGKRNARLALDPARVAPSVEPVGTPKPRTRKVAKS